MLLDYAVYCMADACQQPWCSTLLSRLARLVAHLLQVEDLDNLKPGWHRALHRPKSQHRWEITHSSVELSEHKRCDDAERW